MKIMNGPFYGAVTAPASKSAAIRAMVCAALCDSETTIERCDPCGDTDSAAACIRALGGSVTRRDDGNTVISPVKRGMTGTLPCGESGAAARFFLPVASALGFDGMLTGEGRLGERPMGGLVRALRAHGADITGEALPLGISSRGLRPGTYETEGDVSSQYISGLMLALPLTGGDCEIRLTSELKSRPYAEMTADVMSKFSVVWERTETGFFLRGGQKYTSPGSFTVEGDWSAAAFFLALGALGGDVGVRGLDTGSLQGDKKIIGILKKLGARVTVTDGEVRASKGVLRAFGADLSDTPDLAPAISAAAAAADGTTVLTGVGRLRLKESDRLGAIVKMLASVGIRAEAKDDSIVIEGGKIKGGRVCCPPDHRMVMAGAVLAAASDSPVETENDGSVNKSYPGFFRDLGSLGREQGEKK